MGFVDGETACAAIADAIESAKQYVYIMCAYASLNFRLRPPNQEQLLDLCARAVGRGVKVALLIGLPTGTVADTVPQGQADAISARGILARWDKAKCSGIYRVAAQLGCHHQKMFVIDGERAFVGGINMVQSYWDTRAHAPDDERRVTYNIVDAAARIAKAQAKDTLPLHDAFSTFTGPAVADVEANFVERWNGAGVANKTSDLAPSPAGGGPDGATRIQIVRTTAPHTYPHCAAGEESVKEAMLNLINGATVSIYFENQCFFDGDFVAAMRTAAKRGVRVLDSFANLRTRARLSGFLRRSSTPRARAGSGGPT